MDALAACGSLAAANNTPDHLPAGSEVANLCLLGYDPDVYFTGRAPLEAAAQGITLGEGRLGGKMQLGDDRRLKSWRTSPPITSAPKNQPSY